MSPTQSLETYQLDAVNPTPDIAALDAILPRLLALPATMTTPAQRDLWTKTLVDLPRDSAGQNGASAAATRRRRRPRAPPTILPAEKYGKTSTKRIRNYMWRFSLPARWRGQTQT